MAATQESLTDHNYCCDDVQLVVDDNEDEEKENQQEQQQEKEGGTPAMKLIRRLSLNSEHNSNSSAGRSKAAAAAIPSLASGRSSRKRPFPAARILGDEDSTAKEQTPASLPSLSLKGSTGSSSSGGTGTVLSTSGSNVTDERALSPSPESTKLPVLLIEPDPAFEEELRLANGFVFDAAVCNTAWEEPTSATIGRLEAIHLANEADGDCQMRKFYGGFPVSDLNYADDIDTSLINDKRSGSAMTTAVDYDNEGCLQPVTEDNQWAVEKILRKRRTLAENGKRTMSFYIKWEGWDYNFCTWEDYNEANNLDRSIKSFERRSKWRHSIYCRECRGRKSEQFMRILPRFKNAYQHWFSNKNTFFACHRWEDEMNKILKKWEAEIKCKQAPLYVENWVDDEAPPTNFQFILENKLSEEAQKNTNGFMKLEWCMCKNNGVECGSVNNCCPEIFGQRYCYKDGNKIDAARAGTNWIVECTDGCSCDINCPTRVIQRGRRIPLVLFRTIDRGWSVRTTIFIERNLFVCEYVGEVLTVDEAFALNKPSTYQFQMDGAGEHKLKFVVDAAEYGNEARFINHSCSPNLIVRSVFADRLDECYHRIAFFAKRDIKAGEELTIDYCAIDSNAQGRQKKKCNCNTQKCRGFFYY